MGVLIIGSGVSGRAIYDYLNKNNIKSFFLDDFGVDINDVNEVRLNKLKKNIEYAVISPGISLKSNIVLWLKKNNIAFLGEFEFGVTKTHNDIIAVTGTNGKTTTVSLIYYLLRKYSAGVLVGGNIGVPVTSLLDNLSDEKLIVLECSSFQLETIKNFRPHIAVVLNITEDHLNRHKTMSEYIRCKYKITKNQTSTDYLILNADDENIRKNPPKTKAQIFYFSTKRKVFGCYLRNKTVYFWNGVTEIRLISLSRLKIKGEHNLSNSLASLLAVFLQTENLDLLKDVLNFEGVEHRIEFVKKIRGVEFYNDSKATNIASVLVACNSFKNNIFLILGGSDKGYEFDELFIRLSKNVKYIAIFGETKHKIAFSAQKFNFKNYCICNTLEEAVNELFNKAVKNDIILLSPACASFDQFSGYEERGNLFKKIVHSLTEK